MNAKYVFTLLSTSKQKRNYDVLAELEYPQRFGYPVMVILDQDGNRIHTQNSVFLEKDKSYDEKIVKNFLYNWGPSAIDPKSYK